MFATLNGEVDNSNASSSGNLTQTQASNLTGTVSWTLRMPHFLSATRRSLQTNITVTQNTNSSCIQRTSDTHLRAVLRRSTALDVETGFTATVAAGHPDRTAVRLRAQRRAEPGPALQHHHDQRILIIPLSGLGM